MPRITYALDTSALIVYLREEPGYERFVELLKQEGNYFAIHIINLGELYYLFWRSDGETKAGEAWSKTSEMPIQIVDSISDSFVRRVGRWKATQRISYADAFALATAEEHGVPLVTTDHQDFNPIESAGLLQFCWLR
jgi:predicted nucleic acid-binding protein